jgi:hypothetical protein
MISVRHPTNSVTDSINSMDKLETEGEARTYKNVTETVLAFLLSETASKNAAFLPDKAWGTSGRYAGVIREVLRGGDCTW